MSAAANQKHAGTEPMKKPADEQTKFSNKEKPKETPEENNIRTTLPPYRYWSPNSDYPYSSSSGSSSSRLIDSDSTLARKRTKLKRLMDYQIKALQEFFQNNRYPLKHDLEYLSDSLDLSSRIIDLWFRTARQKARRKARKSHKNQPAAELIPEISDVAETSRFKRTPDLNDHKCTKRLSDHSSCSKKEDVECSAQDQKARFVIVLTSEGSSSSSTSEQSTQQPIQSPPHNQNFLQSSSMLLTPSPSPT